MSPYSPSASPCSTETDREVAVSWVQLLLWSRDQRRVTGPLPPLPHSRRTKISTRIMATYNAGCWPTARTPASPTTPMARPAARTAGAWMKQGARGYEVVGATAGAATTQKQLSVRALPRPAYAPQRPPAT